MRIPFLVLITVVLCGCPRRGERAANQESAASQEPAANREPAANPEPAAAKGGHHPYENVTPEKVKERLERIQRDAEERNERRLREVQ